jgi:hypothetical protein
VVTIAMVVLLTLLVIAFLSLSLSNRLRADADNGGREAGALADTAEAVIVADLLEEMRAGSAATTATPDGGRLFDVTDPKGMVPARVLRADRLATTDAFTPLLKQSAAAKPFDGKTGSTRASGISTTAPTPDGRRVAASRWLAPRFFTPGETLDDAEVPDWIYHSRDGSHPAKFDASLKAPLAPDGQPAPAYVVGRYAYQIYSTGGLLDANIAGHGSGAPAGDAATKGSLVWVDLTALTGTGSAIAGLPDWRHPSGWTDARVELVENWGNPRGWRQTFRGSGKSDGLFLGRRDLIAFQQAFPDRLPAAALPHFTHLTLELNQPSWSPARNSTGADYAYLTRRDNPKAPNRRILGVRATGSFERYTDLEEGTVTAREGEPLVHRRFPLRWIEWFRDPAAHEALITRHFGLKRDADGYRWNYTELTTSQAIKTLDEIATSGGREPNFFELLHAGILSGSLAAGTGGSTTFFNSPNIDASTAAQVLRIGACVIDQYDEDDDPTVIAAVPGADPFGPSGLVDIAGVENLPYIDVIGQQHIRRRDLAGSPEFPNIACYYQLQLWNPHRDALKMKEGKFRVIGEGEPYVRIGWWPAGWQTPPVYWEEGDAFIANEKSCFMEFSVPLKNTSSTRFEKPVHLLGKHLSTWSPDNVLPGGSSAPKFAGIYLGKVKCGEDNPGSTTRHPNCGEIQGHLKFDRPMTLKLQKQVDGIWVTYQTIPAIEEHHGNIPWPAAVDDAAFNGVEQLRITYARSDPRTIRFGMSSSGSGTSPKVVSKTVDPALNQAEIWDNKAATGGGLGGTKGNAAQLAFNDGTGWSYTHRDGVRRLADPARNLPVTAGNPYAYGEARPHVLNRPFRSVAEMGHAFRDEPWKSLDFHKDTSPDSGLLDLFTLSESAERAGVLNPNTASAEVLAAALSGMELDPVTGTTLTTAQARTLAKAIRASLAANPLRHPGEIVERVKTVGSVLGKRERELESLARGLADISSTRTWTLMIDLVAQSGRLIPKADGLDDFAIRGEKRYWVHLVIDRFTGKTLARQIEPVFE